MITRNLGYLGEVTALISVPLFHFYDSLVLLSVLANASNSEKEVWLNRVNINQEKMQRWAHDAPMNYLHKFQLVEAEKARVLGQVLEAEEFYEQAIAGASENKFIQEEALAYELAAKFYLERGRLKINTVQLRIFGTNFRPVETRNFASLPRFLGLTELY